MRIKTVAMAALVAAAGATMSGAATAQADRQAVSFASTTYPSLRELLGGRPPSGATTVEGELAFPEHERGRTRTAILLHTAAGYQEANEGWHAAELRKAGFATLTYDSFAARKIDPRALSAQAEPPWASALADLYAAQKFLVGHARVDPDRIVVVGFSFGGEIAHLAAMSRLRAALGADKLSRFAAHVALYPAGVYGAAPEARAYTGAPVLLMLGGADDNLPPGKMDAYLAYARGLGHPTPVAVELFPGAPHAWTVSTLGALRAFPDSPSAKRCPLVLLGPGAPTLLVAGEAKPFDAQAMQACSEAGRGYTRGFDEAARARSLGELVGFLQRHTRL